LKDGEIPLDNTRAERALRTIVVGRKNWLFYGTDTHAEAAAAIFSIIASCRLHAIDPFTYFDEVLRVLPYWPHDRYLELAPQHWLATRARLDPSQLNQALSVIAVPPPAASPTAG
jgi:transposase